MTDHSTPENGPVRDYEVGKGKPPKRTQFPNQVNSRRGKKKGTKNWATLINEELDQELEVQENGRSRKIDKRRLVVKALVNKAAKGDLKAAELLIRNAGGTASDDIIDLEGITPEMVASFVARLGPQDGEDLA